MRLAGLPRRVSASAAGATLQPARLALGLRRELLRRGVRIFESSPVGAHGRRPARPRARRRAATSSPDRGVLGLGAWMASLPRFHRAIVPRGTYIVLTEPAPERLEEIGWTGGEGIGDLRTALHYLRTTPDGRIAFGAAAATAGVGTGLGPRLRYDQRSIVKLVDDFRRFFPSWDGVGIEAAWGGPMDVTALHQPFFGTLRRRRAALRGRLHRRGRRPVPPRRDDPGGARARRSRTRPRPSRSCTASRDGSRRSRSCRPAPPSRRARSCAPTRPRTAAAGRIR